MKLKKITGIFTALTLALTLTACGGPGDAYENAADNYESSNGVTSTFKNTITVTEGDASATSIFVGTLMINHDGEDSAFYVDGTLTTNADTASAVETPIKAYYFEGVYYADMLGSKYSYQCSFDDAVDQIGLLGFASKLTASDFQAISTEEGEDGEVLKYVIAPANEKLINGVDRQWTRFALQGSDGGTVSLKEATGSVVLDGSDPASQSFVISGSVIMGSTVHAVTNTIENTFDLSGSLDIPEPNVSEYTPAN